MMKRSASGHYLMAFILLKLEIGKTFTMKNSSWSSFFSFHFFWLHPVIARWWGAFFGIWHQLNHPWNLNIEPLNIESWIMKWGIRIGDWRLMIRDWWFLIFSTDLESSEGHSSVKTKRYKKSDVWYVICDLGATSNILHRTSVISHLSSVTWHPSPEYRILNIHNSSNNPPI